MLFAVWPLLLSLRFPLLRALVSAPLAGVFAAHFVVEGWRWQMAPLYAIALWIIGRGIRRLATGNDPSSRARSLLLGLGVSAAFLVGISGPVLLPVVELRAPMGGLSVGSTSLHLVDKARVEQYGPTPGGSRELTIQVWYPTDSVAGLERMKWVEDTDDFTAAISTYFSVPSFSLDHLIYSETNSYIGADLSDLRSSYPVVIYSHGWGGFRTIALTQAERLASEGFVVVSIDHTYFSLSTTLSDGTKAPIDATALPLFDTVSEEVFAERAITMIDTFAADISFVLDEVERIAVGEYPELAFLSNRIEANSVGIYGHSTGGGAAVEVCSADPRCAAYLGLDPWVEPVDDEFIEAGIHVPSMILRSEAWSEKTNDPRLQDLWAASSTDGPLLCIKGSTHRDFMLLSHISPLADYVRRPAPLQAERMDRIIEDHLAGFFSEHLLDLPPANLEFEELATCLPEDE